MPKPIGPTIPRWQLGEELDRLRKKADYTRQQIAARLRCSVSKIEKIEGGQVGIKVGDLEIMLAEYGLDRDDWPPLLELQRLGNTRGWWSKFGRMPAPFTEFLGLEMAAETIRTFELAVVPGLFQTEAYARALTTPTQSGSTGSGRTRSRLRWAGRSNSCEDSPGDPAVLDESATAPPHRGSRGDARAAPAPHRARQTYTIQVVPFEHGAYPGIARPLRHLRVPRGPAQPRRVRRRPSRQPLLGEEHRHSSVYPHVRPSAWRCPQPSASQRASSRTPPAITDDGGPPMTPDLSKLAGARAPAPTLEATASR